MNRPDPHLPLTVYLLRTPRSGEELMAHLYADCHCLNFRKPIRVTGTTLRDPRTREWPTVWGLRHWHITASFAGRKPYTTRLCHACITRVCGDRTYTQAPALELKVTGRTT